MHFIVVYTLPEEIVKSEYVKASSAQDAVNIIRLKYKGVKIREVAKIMKTWK